MHECILCVCMCRSCSLVQWPGLWCSSPTPWAMSCDDWINIVLLYDFLIVFKTSLCWPNGNKMTSCKLEPDFSWGGARGRNTPWCKRLVWSRMNFKFNNHIIIIIIVVLYISLHTLKYYWVHAVALTRTKPQHCILCWSGYQHWCRCHRTTYKLHYSDLQEDTWLLYGTFSLLQREVILDSPRQWSSEYCTLLPGAYTYPGFYAPPGFLAGGCWAIEKYTIARWARANFWPRPLLNLENTPTSCMEERHGRWIAALVNHLTHALCI